MRLRAPRDGLARRVPEDEIVRVVERVPARGDALEAEEERERGRRRRRGARGAARCAGASRSRCRAGSPSRSPGSTRSARRAPSAGRRECSRPGMYETTIHTIANAATGAEIDRLEPSASVGVESTGALRARTPREDPEHRARQRGAGPWPRAPRTLSGKTSATGNGLLRGRVVARQGLREDHLRRGRARRRAARPAMRCGVVASMSGLLSGSCGSIGCAYQRSAAVKARRTSGSPAWASRRELRRGRPPGNQPPPHLDVEDEAGARRGRGDQARAASAGAAPGG